MISYLVARAIVTSKYGKVLVAVRDAESRVRFLGYRVENYKLFAFVVSAIIAGVGVGGKPHIPGSLLASVHSKQLIENEFKADGIAVVGPTDHTIFKSIYFFDPSGHRLELAVNTGTPKMSKLLDEAKWDMLNEWAVTKKAPQHARWMHDGSYAQE